MKVDKRDVIAIVGLLMIFGGLCLWSTVVALVVTGVALFLVAVFLIPGGAHGPST